MKNISVEFKDHNFLSRIVSLVKIFEDVKMYENVFVIALDEQFLKTFK